MRTHRETYPEQYTHPLVGKRVRACGVEGVVVRVMDTRFGLLADLGTKDEHGSPMAYAVGDCKLVQAKVRKRTVKPVTVECEVCERPIPKADIKVYRIEGGTGYPAVCEDCAELEVDEDAKISAAAARLRKAIGFTPGMTVKEMMLRTRMLFLAQLIKSTDADDVDRQAAVAELAQLKKEAAPVKLAKPSFRRYQCRSCGNISQFLSTGHGDIKSRCNVCLTRGEAEKQAFAYIGSEESDPKLLD